MKIFTLLLFMRMFCLAQSEAADQVEFAAVLKQLEFLTKALADTRFELKGVKSELDAVKHKLGEDKCRCKSNSNDKLAEENQSSTEKTNLGGGKRLLTDQTSLHQLDLDVQNLRGNLAGLQSKHEADIQSLNGKVASIQSRDVKVGFTAILGNDISNLGDNQVITFDNVLTNEGNGYNGNTGVFTCHVPGFYVFYTHILAEVGKHVDTRIMKNQIDMAFTYSFDKEAFSSGSNMAVMNLQRGDTVVVRTYGDEHDTAGAIIDYKYSSFSGFLILAS